MRDFRETWKEGTAALGKALQHYVEKLGVPFGVLCNVVQFLQRCMEPLMHLEDYDIPEASLLKATDNEPGAFPTPVEEATLLGKELTPQEAWETTTHPPDHPEETPKPEVQLD